MQTEQGLTLGFFFVPVWKPLLLRLGEVNSGDVCQVRGWLRYNQCPPEDGEDGG